MTDDLEIRVTQHPDGPEHAEFRVFLDTETDQILIGLGHTRLEALEKAWNVLEDKTKQTIKLWLQEQRSGNPKSKRS